MNDTILKRILSHYGRESQEAMLIGEMGELLTLFGRRAQGRDSREQWISEIADATILLRQMAIIHGVEAVDVEIAAKLERMEERLYHSSRTKP